MRNLEKITAMCVIRESGKMMVSISETVYGATKNVNQVEVHGSKKQDRQLEQLTKSLQSRIEPMMPFQKKC